MSVENTETASFRDKISTVDDEGKRIWIYPKKPKGKYHRYRVLLSVFLLLFFFVGPLIKINNQPLLLLNILERKFIIFGTVFWPQDFHLFVIATISLVIFIVLFTVIYGRIWCGWACPQTVFMEMVFRKIEYWIEGDAYQQRALKNSPLNFNKLLKKSSKHAIFYGISFVIGNTFLAYIIGVEELIKIITDPPSEHLTGLTAMIIFSGIFYWVFAFFREQVCTMVCPYGRLQGVLLDQDSIVVAYDFKRGEPRGKLKKGRDADNYGDCIACNQCVEVCPTGIDIRNGTQLECVNCTACMDACDNIMVKIKRPTGLIRYASYNGILKGIKLKITPRIIGYSIVLILLLTTLLVMFLTKSDIDTTILRTPGVMYQETEQGIIKNLYNINIINKTMTPQSVNLKLIQPQGKISLVGGDLNIPASEMVEKAFFVEINKEKFSGVSLPIIIGVYSTGKKIDEIYTTFLGPNPYSNQ